MGSWSRDGDCSESATGKLGCTPPHKRVVLELHDSGVVMDVVAKQQLETTRRLRPTRHLCLGLEVTRVAQMRQVLFLQMGKFSSRDARGPHGLESL